MFFVLCYFNNFIVVFFKGNSRRKNGLVSWRWVCLSKLQHAAFGIDALQATVHACVCVEVG